MKAAIFDFDGTLVQLSIPWIDAKKEMIDIAKAHDIEVEPELPIMDMSNLLAEHSAAREEIFLLFRRYETECIRNKEYSFFPCMEELLRELDAGGWKLAIASANCVQTIEAILKEKNLLDLFDAVFGRDSVKRNKPDPEQLNSIMKMLGIKKEDVIYIGDLVYDELAAKNAGVAFFNINGHGKKTDELRELLFKS